MEKLSQIEIDILSAIHAHVFVFTMQLKAVHILDAVFVADSLAEREFLLKKKPASTDVQDEFVYRVDSKGFPYVIPNPTIRIPWIAELSLYGSVVNKSIIKRDVCY